MNEIMPFAATWMDLEIIILNELSQRQILCDITYMWNLKILGKWIYLQNWNRLTNWKQIMVTKVGNGGEGRNKLGLWD